MQVIYSLSEAARKQAEEVGTQARFVTGGFFSRCTWKSTWGVHAVCMRTDDWEILGVQEAQLSWTVIDCVLFCFSSTLSDEQCFNLSFEIKIQTRWIALSCSHKDNSGTRGVYCWRWWCMNTYHSRNSAFLLFNCVAYFSSEVFSETSNAPTWV